jgi:hypothetical protein
VGSRHRGRVPLALAWACGITAGEYAARRLFPRRNTAWLAAYSVLGVAGMLAGARAKRGPRPLDARTLLAGSMLAAAGYPLGRWVAGDRPSAPVTGSAVPEALVIAAVVAPAEELLWGGLVEPAVGVVPTAALFAAKHVVIDGRWRRTAGLALFWAGLGLVRHSSPRAALALHVACNAGGVALGHLTGLDQF